MSIESGYKTTLLDFNNLYTSISKWEALDVFKNKLTHSNKVNNNFENSSFTNLFNLHNY